MQGLISRRIEVIIRVGTKYKEYKSSQGFSGDCIKIPSILVISDSSLPSTHFVCSFLSYKHDHYDSHRGHPPTLHEITESSLDEFLLLIHTFFSLFGDFVLRLHYEPRII